MEALRLPPPGEGDQLPITEAGGEGPAKNAALVIGAQVLLQESKVHGAASLVQFFFILPHPAPNDNAHFDPLLLFVLLYSCMGNFTNWRLNRGIFHGIIKVTDQELR